MIAYTHGMILERAGVLVFHSLAVLGPLLAWLEVRLARRNARARDFVGLPVLQFFSAIAAMVFYGPVAVAVAGEQWIILRNAATWIHVLAAHSLAVPLNFVVRVVYFRPASAGRTATSCGSTRRRWGVTLAYAFGGSILQFGLLVGLTDVVLMD